jgi:glycosyltransferase involved in cell wall biosynthesis
VASSPNHYLTNMAEQRALWVSTSVETRGGIATYVRAMQQTPLWTDWNIRHVATHRDGSTAAKIAAFARGALLFVVELIRFRPTVVHLHAASRGSFVRKATLFWISRPTRVPVVVHMHGSGFEAYYERSPRAVRAIIRATLSRASAFVTLGEVRSARMRVIAPAARITAIPNAVRLARPTAQPAPGEPVHVVFLGRIGDHKGTFSLLDAWAEVARDPEFNVDHRKAAILTIAGDGEVERARHRIRELRVEDTVEVRDWLSENDVGELLDRAQVLALPSRNEGQPMAVLEAMARGLCVVASDVGGLSEMIDGGCGVVVTPDNVASIAAALRLVIYDDGLRTRHGAAAYARVENEFDICTVSRRLDALYREVAR